MFGSGIYFQFLGHLTAQGSLGQHADNGTTDSEFRLFSHQLPVFGLFQAAGISAVMIIDFLIQLFAGQDRFGSIHDDDKITGIHIGRINGLVFAAQDICDLAGQTAQNHSICVNDIPFAVNVGSLRNKRLQDNSSSSIVDNLPGHDGQHERLQSRATGASGAFETKPYITAVYMSCQVKIYNIL